LLLGNPLQLFLYYISNLKKLERLTLYENDFTPEQRTSFISTVLHALPQLKELVVQARNDYEQLSGFHLLPPGCGQLKLEHFNLPPNLTADDAAKMPNVTQVQFGGLSGDLAVSL